MRRDRRLLWTLGLAALACGLALTAFVLASGVLLVPSLTEAEQGAWHAMTADRWPVLLLPGLALMGAAAAIAATLYRRLVAAPAQLAEQARVLLSTNVARDSLDPSWPADLRALAQTIDALAAQREQLRAVVLGGEGEWRDRVALRSIDDQIKSMLSALGFTPADRTRMGVAEVRAVSKLEQLQARARR